MARDQAACATKRFYFGFGYGADMNGFGAQGGPRNGANPVTYPFKSFDGKVTLDRQRSGERVFDINTDGVAHYGLYPDWIEDLRKIAGDGDRRATWRRGAEAYLQMWERAEGIRGGSCRASRARFTRRGLGRVRLGATHAQTLRRAGQPSSARRSAVALVRAREAQRQGAHRQAVLTRRGRAALVVSSARGHRVRGIGPGARSRRLRGRTRSLGRGLYVRNAGGGARFVFGVRRGKVRYAGVASRSAAKSRTTLRRHLRLAGLR